MDGEVMPPRFDVRAMLQNPRAALAVGFVLGVIVGAVGLWLLNRPVQPPPLTQSERIEILESLQSKEPSTLTENERLKILESLSN